MEIHGGEIKNFVISHILFIRYPLNPSLSTLRPGDHKSTYILQNGTVIGHEKYISLF